MGIFDREQRSVGGSRLIDEAPWEDPSPAPAIVRSYGERQGWYGEAPEAGAPSEEQLRAAWDGSGSIQRQFNGDYEEYRRYQLSVLARKEAGLEDDEVYNKAVELHELSTRKSPHVRSEWERKLRDSYRDSTNAMYSRAQASGRNRAAVARAYESGIAQQDAVMERQIGAMREEESRVASDALANLLFQARAAGAEGAAAEAALLQQWQHAKDQERMDMIANVVGAISTVVGAVIL